MIRAVTAATDDRFERVLALVRSRGGRITDTRRAVLRAMFDSKEHHLTANDILASVADVDPEPDRATVYRTLELLTDLGVVEHVHLGHSAAVYHLADVPHQHLVCDRCGAVVQVPLELFAPLLQRIDDDFEFAVEPGHFALTGLCKACRKKN